jgi:aspartate dehydrogenase
VIRYGIVGYGRIGQRLAARLPGAVAILKRGEGLDAFIARKPSIVVECASAQALAEYGPALLSAGIDLVPLSLAALVDPDVEHRLMAAAERGPGRLEIAPGAIGTLDLLASAREDGLKRVVYRQLKSPAMWQLTPAVVLADLA